MEAVIIGVVTAIAGGVLGFIVNAHRMRAQIKGDLSAAKVSDATAWDLLISNLAKRVTDLEKDLGTERDRNNLFETRINELEAENRELRTMISERDRKISEMQGEITRLQAKRPRKGGMLND